MANVCILTDSTVQFPTPVFNGRTRVHVIPLHIQLNDQLYKNSEGVKASDLPATTRNGLKPAALPPSVQEFQRMFASLGQTYQEIIGIFHSGHLTATAGNAERAAEAAQGKVRIHLVDAQTTAIGLGLVVQAAAAAAEEGMDGEELERMARSLLPRVYSIFCIEGLTYLRHSGALVPAQGLVSEYLKMMGLFVMDNGQFVPTQKARNYRHLVDLLHEFLFEFPVIEHIGILQGVPAFETETRALRERIALDYADTPLSEHTIGPGLATLIGPRSLGLFVLQPE